MKTSGSLEVSHLRTLGKEWSLQAVHRITSRHNVPKWEIFPHVSLSLKLPMRTSALQKMHAEIMRWVHSLTKTKRSQVLRLVLPLFMISLWPPFLALQSAKLMIFFRRSFWFEKPISQRPATMAGFWSETHPPQAIMASSTAGKNHVANQTAWRQFLHQARWEGRTCILLERWVLGNWICLRCLRFTSMAALLTFQDQRKDWNFQTWRNV